MSRISVWQGYINDADLDYRPWYKHREIWEEENADDFESEQQPHDQQLLAALQCFTWMFTGTLLRAWVHLAAEMQAGKSGVANTLIRLVLRNSAKIGIRPERIFVLTGMSDDAWKKQTKYRVPREVRNNVHHSGGLKHVQQQLMKLAAKDGLRDVLIILDESQVASSSRNRPNTLVYKTVRSLVAPEKWVENNIRFLTISATDPAKVMSMEDCEVPCRTVRLQTTKAYQSVESLKNEGRIRALETFGDIGYGESMKELVRVIDTYDTPLWHILRPRQGKTSDVEEKLHKNFPKAQVIAWDSTKKSASPKDESESQSTESLKDINELLASPPENHSFILLKNMFYAAKTLNDEHVGVLWDRLGGVVGGDNARLQSLLGRACGYGKSKRTIIYTSEETVDRYLTFWKELCHSTDAQTTTVEHKAESLNRRMPGVGAITVENGAKVSPLKNVSTPLADSNPNAIAAGSGAGRASTFNDNDYEVEWREFNTIEEAKVFAPRVRKPKNQDADGFLLSTTTSKLRRLSYADVMAMKGMRKTSGFGLSNSKKLKVGESSTTLYVCYRNLENIESVVYVVGKITRVSE